MTSDFRPSKPYSLFKEMMELVPVSQEFVEVVRNQYIQGSRYYHNISHLATMWNIHKQLSQNEILDEVMIASAIAYHDFWYDPLFAESNETWSAHIWRTHCLVDEYREPVARLIESTADHFKDRGVNNSFDIHREWFLGLDLASLAAPWEIFNEQGNAIRLEYSCLSDDVWTKGRQSFFKSLCETAPLFKYDVLRDNFQEKAYANVQRALDHFKQPINHHEEALAEP